MKRGEVSYTIGNFNHDDKMDMILTSASGSVWYYSTGTGTWNETAWTQAHLKRGAVQFTVGNFDGGAGDDLIVTTERGSRWYTTVLGGGWHTAGYDRPDLPL